MLEWGQPYSPYEPDFNHDVYNNGSGIPPTLGFSNQNAMMSFGQNVDLSMFDVVQNFTSGTHNLPDGTYSFDDLVNMGIATGGNFGDHRISTNLYGTGNFDINDGLQSLPNLMYIFGSVRFEIQPGAQFIVENGEFTVNATIGVIQDDFDFDSTSFPANVLNPFLEFLANIQHHSYEKVILIYEGQGPNQTVRVIPENDFCFLGDTAISMWPLDPNLKPGPNGIYDQDEVQAKIWKKPIRDIRVKDIVVAHDKDGNLVPDVVSRTMQNDATHILDFWGTGVTPGHAYLCGDGKHEGKHIPLIDILRQDGAIVLENGTKVRAATNWPVGSLPDQFIWVLAGHDDGRKTQVTDKKKIRIGTRAIAPNGTDYGVLDHLVQVYGPLSEDGISQDGIDVTKQVLHWPYGDTIPNPEDYILQRSDLTLEEIYAANEWEQIGTRMPPPSSIVSFNPRAENSQAGLILQASKPMPNIPPAFADHPDVSGGTTKLNSKHRKAMEALKRKTARVKMRKLQ